MTQIDTKTKISLGFAAVVLLPAIWWASDVSTKLTIIQQGQTYTKARVAAIEEKLSDVEARVRVLERR